MAEGGIVKRAYDAVALFALLNIVAVGGFVAYLTTSGIVDGEKLREMIGLLRADGDEDQDAEGEEGATADTAATVVAARKDVNNADQQAQIDVEILHREAERIKVELEQRLALSNSILLKVRNEREAFKAEREAAADQTAQERAARRDVGFEKQVAIFSSLSPKIAVQHLLGLNDPSEAARMLMSLETDKAKKIVEAAKRGDDLAQMRIILKRMRSVGLGG